MGKPWKFASQWVSFLMLVNSYHSFFKAFFYRNAPFFKPSLFQLSLVFFFLTFSIQVMYFKTNCQIPRQHVQQLCFVFYSFQTVSSLYNLIKRQVNVLLNNQMTKMQKYLYTKIKTHVSMIRKYHNNTMQTNPRHREEESQNTDFHNTSGRQFKLIDHLSLPHQDDCKTRRTQ